MRNEFSGACYRCGQHVKPGDGHFERIPRSAGQGMWRVQHAECAIEHRGTKWAATAELAAAMAAVETAKARLFKKRELERAMGTGKSAQRARKRLREAGRPEVQS